MKSKRSFPIVTVTKKAEAALTGRNLIMKFLQVHL